MPVTVESVKALAASGEFDSVKDAAIEKAIADASATIESTSWCAEHVDAATENLAAHLLALRVRGSSGPGGPVASASADGLSVSYAVPPPRNAADGYYMKTTYGEEYLRLRRLQPLSPLAGCTTGSAYFKP